MHKLNYFPKLFGRIACVGCGRCILYCPVNFDIRQTIEEIKMQNNQFQASIIKGTAMTRTRN